MVRNSFNNELIFGSDTQPTSDMLFQELRDMRPVLRQSESPAGDKRNTRWDICGSEIFQNLLRRNDGMIYFPVRDPEGDIVYGGHTFSMKGMKSQYGRDCIE